MIVRIATEGQYRLDSNYLDMLNSLDNEIVEAIAREDQGRYATLLKDMLALVRDHGEPVPPDEIVESHVVLPPPDCTFEDAIHIFSGEGIIPG